MKPTQFKELLANIKATIVSFISIMMFVALSVGIFVGIYRMSAAIENTAQAYFDDYNFHNFQITSAYGFTESDIEKLKGLEGIDEVEATRQTFLKMNIGNERTSAKVLSLPESINMLDIKEGKLPVQDNELLMLEASASKLGLTVGDTFSFEKPEDDYLCCYDFTIVGIANSPEFVAIDSSSYGISPFGSGTITAVCWVCPDVFNSEAFFDLWPVVNIRSHELDSFNTFSKEYANASDAIEDRINELGTTLAHERYVDLRTEVEDEISEGETKLADAREDIADGERKLKDARAEIDDGEEKLAAAEKEIDDTKKMIEEGGALLALAQPGLAEQVAQSEEQIKEQRKELDKARDELSEKEQEIEDARKELQDKTAEVDEARDKLDQLKDVNWAYVSRSNNGGVTSADALADIMIRMSYSMAALFVIVGMLVSYSAVSRLVHEQIILVGTKKALGLRRREITASFLLYTAIAVVIGSVCGLIIGTVLVESIIGIAVSQSFIFAGIQRYFSIPLALITSGIELLLVLGATWLACHSILRSHAVELLRGEKPPTGKERFFEKWAVWNKLPLYYQTIVNNCLNDKRRVFSTVVGVAGCTALVVTAITLNNNVLDSFDFHYRDIYHFNTISFVDDNEENSDEKIQSIIEDEGFTASSVYRKPLIVELPSGEETNIRLVVPKDNSEFTRLYHIPEAEFYGGELSSEGAWVCSAVQAHHNAKVGDILIVKGSDGTNYEVPIAGFYTYYLQSNEMVLGRDAYEALFDTEFEANAILANIDDASIEKVKEKLLTVESFSEMFNDKEMQANNFRTFSSVSSNVVMIYLVLASLMALVVLLNLNVMFIDEKKRELIVLMINGFSVKDAKKYIYNDTIVFTIVGILIGLVLGIVMGSITVGSIEVSFTFFYKGINVAAVVIGVVFSAILSLLMSIIALRRIPRFKLTDINKP